MNQINENGDKPFEIRKRSYFFSRDLISFIQRCSCERIFTVFFSQVVRSGTSIGANLVEGKAGGSRKDWLRFYVIALRSANETKYWLCLIRDTLEVDKQKISALIKEADEISKIIASIIMNAGSGKI